MKKLSIIPFFMVLLIMCLASRLHAHEVRPGYLDLRQTGTETFNVLWKVPARGDLQLSLKVWFTDNCKPITPHISYQSAVPSLSVTPFCAEAGLPNASSVLTDSPPRLPMCLCVWSG
jgi:hypothetical protein